MSRRSPPAFLASLLSAALLSVSLSGCDAACAVLGDFEGTFEGDASGNLTLSIVQKEGDTETAMSTLTLESDVLSALAESEIACEGGELQFDLQDSATGEAIGALEGAFDSATGSGSGEWSIDQGDLAGAVGTWSL